MNLFKNLGVGKVKNELDELAQKLNQLGIKTFANMSEIHEAVFDLSEKIIFLQDTLDTVLEEIMKLPKREGESSCVI